MPFPGIWIMPDPLRTRVCPAANAMLIAAVASRTHAIVEMFRRVRSAWRRHVQFCCLNTRFRGKRLVLRLDVQRRYGGRRRGTLPAWQALRLAWDAAPALALPNMPAGSRGRRDDVAR
eukprot:760014-Pleurochrysis_carterae.AAC.1